MSWNAFLTIVQRKSILFLYIILFLKVTQWLPGTQMLEWNALFRKIHFCMQMCVWNYSICMQVMRLSWWYNVSICALGKRWFTVQAILQQRYVTILQHLICDGARPGDFAVVFLTQYGFTCYNYRSFLLKASRCIISQIFTSWCLHRYEENHTLFFAIGTFLLAPLHQSEGEREKQVYPRPLR